LRYKSTFSIVTCVLMGSIIVVFSEPTIFVSRRVIVKIFPVLLVKVWKYFISLSIEFVVQVSKRHISYSI
jgi:hypothetical protein